MTLAPLARLVASLDALAPLRNGTDSVTVSGLLQAARPAVIAGLLEATERPALVLTGHAQAAHELASELAEWSTRRVAYFPALESMPYERVHMDRAVVAARETLAAAVARGDVDIVVAPIRAILQPLNRPDGAENTPFW